MEGLRYEQLPDFLTVQELRKWLRIGERKAYELANTKGFPHLRFGNKKVFPKDQVQEWVNRQVEQRALPQRLRVL